MTAESYESLARQLAASPARAPAEEKEPEPGKRPTFDSEEFAKRFVADPQKGIEFYEDAVYGFRPGQVIPALALELQELKKERQVREASTFMSENPDYLKVPENYQILVETAEEYGLAPTAKGLSAAWMLAKRDEKPVRLSGKREGGGSGDSAPATSKSMPSARRGVAAEPTVIKTHPSLSDLSDDALETLMQEKREELGKALRGDLSDA